MYLQTKTRRRFGQGLIGTLNYGLTTETSFYLDNILHFTPTPRNKKNLDKSIWSSMKRYFPIGLSVSEMFWWRRNWRGRGHEGGVSPRTNVSGQTRIGYLFSSHNVGGTFKKVYFIKCSSCENLTCVLSENFPLNSKDTLVGRLSVLNIWKYRMKRVFS